MKKQIDYDNFLKLVNKNICINLKYFYKQKDYTKLIEQIILVINKCLEINEDKFIIIINCKEYSILETDVDFLKTLIIFLQNTYKDKMKWMYFINYSKFIKTIYNTIKKSIDKDTIPKIVFS
jgi:hypothetical protein